RGRRMMTPHHHHHHHLLLCTLLLFIFCTFQAAVSAEDITPTLPSSPPAPVPAAPESSPPPSELPPLTGGLKAIDVNNSLLLEAIAAVRPQMAAQLAAASPYLHQFDRVLEAYSQVVAG